MGSFLTTFTFLLLLLSSPCGAFVPVFSRISRGTWEGGGATNTALHFELDVVTSARTEWIAAELCKKQMPSEARICLQIATQDGKAVGMMKRKVGKLITSSLLPNGKLPLIAQRGVKQQMMYRKDSILEMVLDTPKQTAEDLSATENETVDVVLSLTAAAPMIEAGMDWKKSVREAARVLKPGGRLIFVEQTDLNGESYADYVQNLYTTFKNIKADGSEEQKMGYFPVFEEVGWDKISLTLVPHIAGVAIKYKEPGTEEDKMKIAAQKEADRRDEASLAMIEGGLRRRRKRKKKKKTTDKKEEDSETKK